MDTGNTLLKIATGDVSSLKKYNPTVIPSNKIRNVVLRKMVDNYRKAGMSETDVIARLLSIDEFVEKGKLTEERVINNRNKLTGNSK